MHSNASAYTLYPVVMMDRVWSVSNFTLPCSIDSLNHIATRCHTDSCRDQKRLFTNFSGQPFNPDTAYDPFEPNGSDVPPVSVLLLIIVRWSAGSYRSRFWVRVAVSGCIRQSIERCELTRLGVLGRHSSAQTRDCPVGSVKSDA